MYILFLFIVKNLETIINPVAVGPSSLGYAHWYYFPLKETRADSTSGAENIHDEPTSFCTRKQGSCQRFLRVTSTDPAASCRDFHQPKMGQYKY